MNRAKARKIAETITNEQLQEMFQAAKNNIKDWEKVATVNKGMTKGAAWNILASNFDVGKSYHIMGKINMIREFGEFLPSHLKPKLESKNSNIKPVHQEPKF